MTTVSLSTRPRRVPLAAKTMTDGRLLLYSEATPSPQAVTLNSSAEAIWKLCDGRRTVSEICELLCAEVRLAPADVLEDVCGSIERLAEMKLLNLTGEGLRHVDWSRMVKPQADLYDAQTALQLRRGRSHRAGDWQSLAVSATLLNGQIALCRCYRDLPGLTSMGVVDAPLDHPNIARAIRIIKTDWPEALSELPFFVQAIHPLLIAGHPEDDSAYLGGALSHGCHDREGAILVTVNCPMQLAECLVHEMSHMKLFALGVYKEHAEAIVLTPPEILFVSPVIKDRKRPMTALLHALYAFLHVAELDVRVLKRSVEKGEQQPKLAARLKRNCLIVDQANATITQNIDVERDAHAFIQGMHVWRDSLSQRCKELEEKFRLKGA